jgi:hypothetical protein
MPQTLSQTLIGSKLVDPLETMDSWMSLLVLLINIHFKVDWKLKMFKKVALESGSSSSTLHLHIHSWV